LEEVKPKALSFVETAGISVAGALLFAYLHVPLPWLLGPLTSTFVYRHVTKRHLHAPKLFTNLSFCLFGYLLGASFTRETAKQIAAHLPTMLFVTALTIGFSLLVGYWIARKAKIGTTTGIFASMPGGLSQMVLLSSEVRDVNSTIVTFMQTFRVLAVIFVVPSITMYGLVQPDALPTGPLSVPPPIGADAHWQTYLFYLLVVSAGSWLCSKLRFPNPILTGPLFVTACAIILTGIPAPAIPTPLILASQVLIGIYIGLMMDVREVGQLKQLGFWSLISSLSIILFALGLAYLINKLHPSVSLVTAFLSTAPGGIAEMGITASLVHADVSMVAAYQLFRLFSVIFAAPVILRWWVAKRQQNPLFLK